MTSLFRHFSSPYRHFVISGIQFSFSRENKLFPLRKQTVFLEKTDKDSRRDCLVNGVLISTQLFASDETSANKGSMSGINIIQVSHLLK